jgi:hypothetical protein
MTVEPFGKFIYRIAVGLACLFASIWLLLPPRPARLCSERGTDPPGGWNHVVVMTPGGHSQILPAGSCATIIWTPTIAPPAQQTTDTGH